MNFDNIGYETKKKSTLNSIMYLSCVLYDCKSQNFDSTQTAKSRSRDRMLRMDAHSENHGREKNPAPRGLISGN